MFNDLIPIQRPLPVEGGYTTTSTGKPNPLAVPVMDRIPVPATVPGNTGVVPPGTPNSTVPGTTTTTTTPVGPAPTITDMLRQTPGYQWNFSEGARALNTSAVLRGIANSGASAKALINYGQNQGDNAYQQFLSNVMAVANQGYGAAGALAGAASNMGAGVSGAMNNAAQAHQNGANAIANAAYQRANATTSMVQGIGQGLGQIAGGIFGTGGSYPGMALSDARLKTNLVKVGEASDGLGIYDWNWKHDPTGATIHGVIAQEVEQLRPWAFLPNFAGEYAGVDYSKLGAL